MSGQQSYAVQEAPRGAAPPGTRPVPGVRVLWVRLVAILALAALAFAAGWAAAPRRERRDDVQSLRSELAEARSRIAALESAPAPAAPAAPEPSPEPRKASSRADTYVVKPGDTLRAIADRFYENPALDDVIARANDIDDPALIHSGLRLKIPKRPEL